MQAESENILVDTKQAFSEKLRQFMEKTGATQAEASQAMGVTDSTFQNYLYGKTSPPVEKVEALAKFYGYKPKWFLQDDAEILVEDVRDAVNYIEKALSKKDLDLDKKSRAIALTSRVLARERELGRQGGFEQRIRNFVEETISLLR